jgi:outer membrane protein W
MNISSITLSLALAGIAGIAMAEDDASFFDTRLNLGIVPGVRKTTYDNGQGSSGTNDTKIKPGYAAQIGEEYGYYLSGPIGVVGGLAVFVDSDKAKAKSGQDSDIKTFTYGAEINAGGAYRFTHDIHVELTPFVGIGRDKTTFESAGPDRANVSGHGTFWDYGIKAGGFYTIQSYQIGIDVGYAASKADASIGDGGTTYKTKAKADGFIAGISLGYRL